LCVFFSCPNDVWFSLSSCCFCPVVIGTHLYVLKKQNISQEEIEKAISKIEERIRLLEEGSCMDAVILPLHASLPPELQVIGLLHFGCAPMSYFMNSFIIHRMLI
jgi:hypothetical protein